ncbi:MAG: hypothetical protein EOP04_01615 [Proteobacteria bacterium]|nr:MAG: hypothetical protein EOP04_01615 [Pseudomonadota bacterium]
MIDLLFINLCKTPGVHTATASAIIGSESSFNEAALNINAQGLSFESLGILRPKTSEEAIKVAERLMASKINFDAGLMQINSANFGFYKITVRDVFNPCTNIRIGTAILKRFYNKSEKILGAGQEALKAALSAYNTGNNTSGFENGYVAKFYGKKVAYKEDPYRASMIPLPEGTLQVIDRASKSPYTISMIQESDLKGSENDKAN